VLRLSATVSADEAALLHVGQELRLQGQPQSGRVVAVLPSVDAKTRRVPLLAEIDNDAKAPLLAGLFVRATITAASPTAALRLPASALRPGSQDEVVRVVAGKARLAHVAFARDADGTLLVHGGLSPEDEVLIAPSAEIRDGDAVAVAPREPG
jgi:multidrug efflux pump subunit AcrA (membrane-fusion protein)